MRWRFSPLASLKIFSLSLTFCSLNMICLSVVFCFFLLGVLTFLDLWFCVCLQCGRFSVIITSNIPSIPFFFWFSHHVCIAPFVIVLQFFGYPLLSLFFFFVFAYQFWSFCWRLFKLADLSSAVPSLLMSYQGRSLFLWQCSNFSHFLLIRL